MNRSVSKILRNLLILSFAGCYSLLGSPKPNIILCMTDDQGWGDTGYNGHPHLQTPQLDRMSKEGVTFNRFYSAGPICSPTRASCYTGRHPYRMGITLAMKGMLETQEIPITTLLKQQGYTTGHFGKWHLGTLSPIKGDQNRWGHFVDDPSRYYCPPWERDVDVCFVTESKVPTWDPMIHPGKIHPKKDREQDKGTHFGNEYFTGPNQRATQNLSGDDSRVIMDRAIPFIQDAVEKDQPFFAVIWFHTPHSPVVGGKTYRNMYADLSVSQQHYYACITAMDEQMGRLRDEMVRLGVADDTMLWFCSDNGPARQGSPREVGSTGGLSGFKQSISEGGIRVPGILVWPNGKLKQKVVNAPCVTSDYLPTILDVLGIELPNDRVYDGMSLMPLLNQERKLRENPIGFLHQEGKEAVWMDDTYKLFVKMDRVQLFDITNDPGEQTDLSQIYPEMVKRMQNELEEWRAGGFTDLARYE